MSLASSLLGEGLRLPISRRGLFSKDDFFSGFQEDYKSAVGDVLDRWRSRSSIADRYASYRKIRDRDASDNNQAATISDTPDNYVIVLDMGKYSGGHITVETQGYSAVVKGEAGGLSYMRRFPLPKDTNIDRVVADLSDEGILSVSAPRKEKGKGCRGGIVTSGSECGHTARTSAEECMIPTSREGVVISTTQRTEDIKGSSNRKGSNSRIIPLTIEDDSNTTTSSLKGNGKTSSIERVIPTIREDDHQNSGQRRPSTQNSGSLSSTDLNRVLPIKRRGRFFQDSTFEGVWNDFENAVDDLVAKKDAERKESPKPDDDKLQSYKNLRKVIKEEDNQAATVSKEKDAYKIVIDVKDFVDGLLDVKALEGSVVITGEKGNNNFERRFSLPDMSQPEQVSAALSADGILTVTAPL